ncbi:MAG: hypothetical protein Q7R96_05215 [Nanoarchaeota archaeon]|nr:hypothetical protein [Nanoarchaeota archaeon]
MTKPPFRAAHFYAALRKLTITDAMYDHAPTEDDLTDALKKAILMHPHLRTLSGELFHFGEGTTKTICLELENLANEAIECTLIQPDGTTFTERHYHFTKRGAYGLLHELTSKEQEDITFIATAINNYLPHRKLGNTQRQPLPEEKNYTRKLTGKDFYTALRAATTYRCTPSLEELERAIKRTLIFHNDLRKKFAQEFTFEEKDGLYTCKDLPTLRSEAIQTGIIEPMGGIYNFINYAISDYTARTMLEKIQEPFTHKTLQGLGEAITKNLPAEYHPKGKP